MKSLIFSIVIFFIAWGLLSGFKITFSPFSIKITALRYAFGWALIIIGVFVIEYNSKMKADADNYIEGYKKGADYVLDGMKKAVDEAAVKTKTENK